MENLDIILKQSNSLNDLSRYFFGDISSSNREKCKKILEENNINWQEWLISKKRCIYCKNCGKEIKHPKIYCDNKCQLEYQYKLYIRDWKLGKKDGMSGTLGISHHIKRYLLEKHNYTCEAPGCNCNWKNPHTGLSILQVHHKDGDATNNKEENLQLLCPNCHAMTDNYGSRNKKSTRTTRKAYRNLNICSIQA